MPNPMNICLVSPGYPPEDGGGIGTYVYQLAKGLAEQGHDVFVIAQSNRADLREEIENIHVFRYKFRYLPKLEKYFPGLRYSLFIGQKIKELDKSFHFDLIEFPNWEGVGLGYLLSRPRKPVVTRLHTAYFETFDIDQKNKKQKFKDHFIRWLEKMAVAKSDILVSSAQYHRQLIAHEYHISESRIKNIPLGVRVPKTPNNYQGNGIFKILCVGRLEHRKGTATLLESIPEILKKYPNVKFLFIGKDRPHAPGGQYFKEYFLKKNPQYADKVDFMGYLPYEQVERYYADTDIFVLPSLCENFGIVYVEAMIQGKPVIGCNATAVPEVVKDQETGILIEPGNSSQLTKAIDRLIENDDLRRTMGERARQWALKEFTQAKMVQETERLYQELIKHAGK